MKWTSKIVLFGLLMGGILSSCDKKTCEEPIPEMGFVSFKPSASDTDYFVLTFSFKDCDGDIGMSPTSTILDENGEVQTTNFKIDLYHVENNQWVKHVFKPGEPGLDAKVPELGNSTANPVLDGEIDKRMHRTFGLLDYDSVMFKSRILDNAGHYSNEVETPGFIIQ